MGVEGEEVQTKGTHKLSNNTIVESFPNFKKERDIQV
jgi:hypothetical protein